MGSLTVSAFLAPKGVNNVGRGALTSEEGGGFLASFGLIGLEWEHALVKAYDGGIEFLFRQHPPGVIVHVNVCFRPVERVAAACSGDKSFRVGS